MPFAGWCRAGFTPPGRHLSDRRDPVEMLIETSRHRISSLLPIRYGRMKQSPFAFLRGSAVVMAADLATTPTSGIWVQSCGDCHLANFGIYSALDGTPIFDVTDFDETLPAPFEWDLKRLAASVAVDARGRVMPERACRDLARGVVTAYRQHMAKLMRLDPQCAWRSRVDVTEVLHGIGEAKLRQREAQAVADRGRGASQGISQAAGAQQVGLAHPAETTAGPARRRPVTTTHSMCSPAPRSRHTR